MKPLEFFDKLMTIMVKDVQTATGAERVTFETNRSRDSQEVIAIDYDFQKLGSKSYSAHIVLGTSSHVLTMHIDESDTRNGNEALLVEKLILLTDAEYEQVVARYNEYVQIVLASKYDKSDEDVFLVVCPGLLDEVLTGNSGTAGE